MNTITIGIDLAKLAFSTCAVDAAGHVRQRKDFRRDAFAAWLPQLPAGTVVAMEACSGAHHWGRRCRDYGLQPKLMAAQFVKPFRKSRTTKNDRNDAEAIATAARQGNMRFVGQNGAKRGGKTIIGLGQNGVGQNGVGQNGKTGSDTNGTSLSTVIPAKAGIQRLSRCSEPTKSLGPRLRGDDET